MDEKALLLWECGPQGIASPSCSREAINPDCMWIFTQFLNYFIQRTVIERYSRHWQSSRTRQTNAGNVFKFGEKYCWDLAPLPSNLSAYGQESQHNIQKPRSFYPKGTDQVKPEFLGCGGSGKLVPRVRRPRVKGTGFYRGICVWG